MIDYQTFSPIVISQYRQGIPGTKIAADYGVSIDSVYRVLRTAGFHGKRIDYDALVPTVVRLYDMGVNADSIAEQLGIEITAVYRTLQKAGYNRRSPSESHCHSGIRHDYFSVIERPEQAYILGFTAADGYNSRSKCTVRYALSPKDRCVLEFIKKEVGTSYDIREYSSRGYRKQNRTIVLDLYSKRISEDMDRIGIVQNKTHVLQFPTLLPHLLTPFMLGYFDGDGCFSCENFSVTGNFDFIKQYQFHLMKLADVNKTKFTVRHPKVPNIVTLFYSGSKNVQRIHATLYANIPFCLQRKRDKIEEYLRQKKRMI